MKNGLLFLFVVTILASCTSRDSSLVDNEPTQQQQQELIAQNLETTEEPEFIIEAEYDPALAEKAEENKRNKIEETSPIALTSDDDDLTEDKNDLPQNVMTRSIKAYDYDKGNNFLSDSDNTAKGKTPKSNSTYRENEKALYFVVAGAYKDENEAKKKSEEITKLGYKVELITFDKNFKSVCVAKLESRSQADLLAKALQTEKIDAYVVKRRK